MGDRRFLEELNRINLLTAEQMRREAELKADRAQVELEKARVELRTAQRIDEHVEHNAAMSELPKLGGGGRA